MVAPIQQRSMVLNCQCSSPSRRRQPRTKAATTTTVLRYSSCFALLLLICRQLYPLHHLLPSTSLLAVNRQRETSLLLQHAATTTTKNAGRQRRGTKGRRKQQTKAKSMNSRSKERNTTIDTNSIAACMLMKDDNHWLIEWLAFHYHVLPLRDLILIRDPDSRTSPDSILERWKGRINITEWDGNAVVPDFKWEQYRAGKIDDTRLHRARQQFFYGDCLRHFHRQGKQWVLLTDTDEFIQPNPYALPPETLVPLEEPGSVLRTLHSQAQSRRQAHAPLLKCLHIPRIQMASQQTLQHVANNNSSSRNNTHLLLPSLNTSHMLTTSWLHHNGNEIIQVPGANLDGKNILNLASISIREIPSRAHSVHMVIPKYCPATNGKRLRHADSWLLIKHYPGTYEQYTYRQDPRDSLSHRRKRWDLWKEMGQPNATAVKDESIGMWLQGFVDSVGVVEAERLLENVGVLEELPTLSEEGDASPAAADR